MTRADGEMPRDEEVNVAGTKEEAGEHVLHDGIAPADDAAVPELTTSAVARSNPQSATSADTVVIAAATADRWVVLGLGLALSASVLGALVELFFS